jgi:CRP-like cAMP-binding protein
VLVEGRLRLEVDGIAGTVRAVMSPGDARGELALLSGVPRPTRIHAIVDSTVALVDRAGFDAMLAEHPVIALQLADEMAREVRAEDDIVRQLLELHAEGLSADELEAALDRRRTALARRGARVLSHTPRALFRRIVILRGGEPQFWMLSGFVLALGTARLVVGMILKYGLEKQLFALVPGNDPNPMHIHHFNYGMILISVSGLAALLPSARRAVRVLAFTFGVGAGLVFDEFGLIYNLNPEYAQRSSLWAAAVAVTLLLQLVYFRGFWGALVRRKLAQLRSGR